MTTSPDAPVATPDPVSTDPVIANTLMIGLPGTGKTSYLGLLFVALVREAGSGPSLALYNEDRAYLNKIAARLQQFEPALRTSVEDRDGLNLTITVPGRDDPLVLAVPDLSGETWETAHVERVLHETAWDEAKNANGFMLFASAASFEETPTIEESRAAAAELGLEAGDFQAAEPTGHADSPSASQVVLVDLIQILADSQTGPFNVSIVLSAYDTVDQTSVASPREWIEMCAPLLAQYLEVNEATVRARVYGASAQGVDYNDADAVDKMAEASLLERAFVLDESGHKTAIHEPLLWALGDA